MRIRHLQFLRTLSFLLAMPFALTVTRCLPTWMVIRKVRKSSHTDTPIFISAFLAQPSTVSPDDQVVTLKRMAFMTMSLFGMYSRRARSSQDVCSMTNGLNVNRIYALSAPTKMVMVEASRGSFDKHLEDNNERSVSFTPKAQPPIASFGVNICDPVPTRIAFIEMFGTYLDLRKDASEKFAVNGKSIRISEGHGVFSCLENSVIRLARKAQTFLRASFILPNLMQIRTRMTQKCLRLEVCRG